MVYGAIDLHTRRSEIRIIDGEGRVIREGRVATTADRLVASFDGVGAVRILVEAGTESEWVACALEGAGYDVIVADPNYAPMYGERQRRVKTDRRDVAALAEANRHGWFRRAYRRSAGQRTLQQHLTSRSTLVHLRTKTISVIRSLVRQEGYRVASGHTEAFPRRLEAAGLPTALQERLAPLRRTVEQLTAEILALDTVLETAAEADPVARQLQTVPGVGVIVALWFRAFIDTVARFGSAAQVSAALGLVPREDSSAERRHRGHITKAGPSDLRSLLVQAAWACWRSKRHGPLGAWVDAVARRRGRRIAVVALARRLSRILFAIWRDGTVFQPARSAAA
jgi:transposase